MATNHYSALDNGVQPWMPPGHARISGDYRQAKDASRFDAMQGIKSPSFAEMNSPVMFEGHTRQIQRAQRGRNQYNWARSEPKMQAIFLGPKGKSSGTGVFIPRRQGIDRQFSKPVSAFSPVLLPCRVIQTLNLNVHELGRQIKPQSEQNKINEVEKNEENLEKQEEDDISFSPEIFLPKEWTY